MHFPFGRSRGRITLDIILLPLIHFPVAGLKTGGNKKPGRDWHWTR